MKEIHQQPSDQPRNTKPCPLDEAAGSKQIQPWKNGLNEQVGHDYGNASAD
ncbi:MAG: hypothetical protein AB8B36_00465 [Prochlorococcus sp.]